MPDIRYLQTDFDSDYLRQGEGAREARVIDRIKDIRTAERSFKTKYNRFTGDFDTLINFVLTDSLEFERKIVDEDDSVAMAQLKKSGRKNSERYGYT